MKKVLITGANKGIGFEVAKTLAQLNYFVFIGSRNPENGVEAVKKLNELGIVNVSSIVINVADISSVRSARKEIESKTKVLDVLINNAGIAGDQPQSLSAGDMNNLRKIFETNFFGAVQTTQEFLPLLKKANRASVINVSSEVGSLAVHLDSNVSPNRAKYHEYGISKTALNAFTIMLANELKDFSISVNSVTPGYTSTDFNQFQGAKTVQDGAKPIVELVEFAETYTAAKFFQDGGEAKW